MKNLIFNRLLLGFAIVVVSLTTAFAATKKRLIEVDYSTKGITINNRIARLPQDQKPYTADDILFTVDGTMYVPLAFIAETLGYKIENNYDNYINIDGGDVVRYRAQSDLLKDAMNYIGVNTPERAAEVWSEGVKGRSAAIQYSVMTKELKEIYAKDLDKWRPNWVTGVSSPWVESYEISNIENPNDNTRVFEVEFNTTSPGSGYGSFTAVLEVINDGGFWRISNVAGDGNSEIYTGFINQS